MPNQVYYFNVRGKSTGNTQQRVNNEAEAESLYKQFSEAVGKGDEFFEVKVGDDKVTLRTNTIDSFGVQVILEQTPEELKQQAIDRINAGYGIDSPYGANGTACGTLAGQKLVGGY